MAFCFIYIYVVSTLKVIKMTSVMAAFQAWKGRVVQDI